MKVNEFMSEDELTFLAQHGKFANFIQQCFLDNIPNEKIEFLFNYIMRAYDELERSK